MTEKCRHGQPLSRVPGTASCAECLKEFNDNWGGGPAVAEEKPTCLHGHVFTRPASIGGYFCYDCDSLLDANREVVENSDPAVSECRHVWITSLIHGFVCAMCDEPVNINNLWPVVVKGSELENLKKAAEYLNDEILLREADKAQELDTPKGGE